MVDKNKGVEQLEKEMEELIEILIETWEKIKDSTTREGTYGTDAWNLNVETLDGQDKQTAKFTWR